MTLMPVISAARQAINSLVILLETKEKYRKQSNNRLKPLADFITQPKHLCRQPVAGVDTDKLYIRKKLFFGRNSIFARI